MFMNDGQEIIYFKKVLAIYFKDSSRIQFKKYQKRAECVKKINLTHSALLTSGAKNANLTEIYSKSVILCDLLTHNITLFPFYTAEIRSGQNYFNTDCKFSLNTGEIPYLCEYISYLRIKGDKWHKPFVFWGVISFWTEHWHLFYIRYP